MKPLQPRAKKDPFLQLDLLFEGVATRLIEREIGPAAATRFRPAIRRQAQKLRRFNPSLETAAAVRELISKVRAAHAR